MGLANQTSANLFLQVAYKIDISVVAAWRYYFTNLSRFLTLHFMVSWISHTWNLNLGTNLNLGAYVYQA